MPFEKMYVITVYQIKNSLLLDWEQYLKKLVAIDNHTITLTTKKGVPPDLGCVIFLAKSTLLFRGPFGPSIQ